MEFFVTNPCYYCLKEINFTPKHLFLLKDLWYTHYILLCYTIICCSFIRYIFQFFSLFASHLQEKTYFSWIFNGSGKNTFAFPQNCRTQMSFLQWGMGIGNLKYSFQDCWRGWKIKKKKKVQNTYFSNNNAFNIIMNKYWM